MGVTAEIRKQTRGCAAQCNQKGQWDTGGTVRAPNVEKSRNQVNIENDSVSVRVVIRDFSVLP